MPDLTDDDSREPVESVVEVKENLDKLKDLTVNRVREVNNALLSLEEKVQLMERARSESWEVISQRLSTLVDGSVSALSERLTDLEQTVQSRNTTPVTDTSATHVSLEAVGTIEQALMSELGKAKDESVQSMLRLSDLLESLSGRQKSFEKQTAGLRSFAQHVEKFLSQSTTEGAPAPSDTSNVTRIGEERPTASQRDVPGGSSSSTRPPAYLQVPRPPTIPAPPVPQENAPSSEPSRVSTAHFSTVDSEVRARASRVDITNPEQWSAGDTSILRNQEAKQVQDIWSLIFETPIQHDYEAGVEVRSLLSTERLEEMDGRLAVTDEDPHAPGVRYVKFWVDETPNNSEGARSHADEPLDLWRLKVPESRVCTSRFSSQKRLHT